MGTMKDFLKNRKAQQTVKTQSAEIPASDPAEPIVVETVTYRCGHTRLARSFMESNCPECAAANAQKNALKKEIRALRKQNKQPQRLPHSSEVRSIYDGARELWHVELTEGDTGAKFVIEASGLFWAQAELDRQYRVWLAQQQAQQQQQEQQS